MPVLAASLGIKRFFLQVIGLRGKPAAGAASAGGSWQVQPEDWFAKRYSIVVDDALRAAVRRARPAALSRAIAPPTPGSAVRPRELQAFMRAGASAEEVATTTGMDVEHVRRFEGPVLAERAWAVRQAQACRIG